MPSFLAFSPTSHGTPSDWNHCKQHFWGSKTDWRFPTVPSAVVDIKTVLEFLRVRKDKRNRPILSHFADPIEQGDGWSRLALKSFNTRVEEELTSKGWQRAWHGCKFESLYSIIYHGCLIESRDDGRGERCLTKAPGVYVHKDKKRNKAEGYPLQFSF